MITLLKYNYAKWQIGPFTWFNYSTTYTHTEIQHSILCLQNIYLPYIHGKEKSAYSTYKALLSPAYRLGCQHRRTMKPVIRGTTGVCLAVVALAFFTSMFKEQQAATHSLFPALKFFFLSLFLLYHFSPFIHRLSFLEMSVLTFHTLLS